MNKLLIATSSFGEDPNILKNLIKNLYYLEIILEKN